LNEKQELLSATVRTNDGNAIISVSIYFSLFIACLRWPCCWGLFHQFMKNKTK